MEIENRKSADFLQACALYDSIFPRYQSVEPQIRRLSEFPGLVCEKGAFHSNQGQKLSCYTYRKEGIRPAGVVIVAHGLGVGGQCVYMAAADYFTSQGYLVFAYDATGNDDSEGESVIGMEQGVIDLSYAISYVEQDSELGQYPIVLYGHSWGGYCVGAVLIDHPEVRAAVAVAGFNRSADWFRYVADASDEDGSMAVLKQYVEQIEQQKFGKYAAYTAMDGFESTRAGIMVIQSRNDRNVPTCLGYDLYLKKYGQDPRFEFQLFDDRGHMYLFYTDEARAYARQRMNELDMTLTEYGKTHAFDKTLGYELDQNLFADIRSFFDRYCRR